MSFRGAFLAVAGVWLSESFKERFAMGSITESQESLTKSICLTLMSDNEGEEILRFEDGGFGGEGVSLIVNCFAKAAFRLRGFKEYSEI